MPVVKGFPSTMMDDCQLNVITLMKHAARTFDRQEIACQTPRGMFRYAYRDAYSRMMRFANAMKKLGVEVGDRIGVLDWNSHRNYEMYFAIPGIGSVMLLLNMRLAPPDLAYVVNHSGTKVVVVDETLVPLMEAIAPMCKGVKQYVIITDKDPGDVQTKLAPVHSYEDLLRDAKDHYDWPAMDEKSACAACYTTGTTGKPKGIYYSQRSTYLHAMAIATNVSMSYTDCWLQLVPMFHAVGWAGPYMATLAGAKIVLPGRYDLQRLDRLAELMVNERVNVTAGAPALFMPMLEYIRKLDRKPDLKGARLLCGASEPPLSMMKDYHRLTGAEVIHAYGATETSPLVSINRLKPWLEQTLTEEERWDLRRKQGYTVVGLDVKVLDPGGREVPHDGKSTGEFCFRGAWITGKYYDPETPSTQFTEDGFWRSGDVGSMDEHAYLKIADRLKDVIKSGGEWISSVDMENALVGHAGVLEAAVIGVAHPKWEERPLALVILREEGRGKVTEEDLLRYLSQSFAKWQLPDHVLFVDEIAKTSVGKMDKKLMREKFKDAYRRQ